VTLEGEDSRHGKESKHTGRKSRTRRKKFGGTLFRGVDLSMLGKGSKPSHGERAITHGRNSELMGKEK